MSRLIVRGRTIIRGALHVQGAKNALLPILACALLTDRPVMLNNCPRITDVFNMLRILETLGCDCEFEGNRILIDPKNACSHIMPQDISKEMRSSIFMLGPILGRFKRAQCVYPGGCDIGERPIDLHLSGLMKLNVRVKETGGVIECDGSDMCGADVHLDYPSVGATENIMMAASGSRGRTRITGAAREPEIEDLQCFLRRIGVNVYGAGTGTITIDGRLHTDDAPIEYSIMPDRIVAGTVLIAAAMTKGDVYLNDICPEHMESLLLKLREAGCDITEGVSGVRCTAKNRPRSIKLTETKPHPGFPTDMQPQLSALCTLAEGRSVIRENVFENRFRHLDELMRMGAVCEYKERTAVISGVDRLSGACVTAHDLRGGAALVLAGLSADGETLIENAEYIDRGYDSIDKMLCSLGADIIRK